MLYRETVAWPHPEMPVSGKSGYFSTLLRHNNRKPGRLSFIEPGLAHFKRVGRLAINRGGGKQYIIINLKDNGQISLSGIAKGYQGCIHGAGC